MISERPTSVIAVLQGGEPTVIPLAEGSRICPSVVGFSRSGERLVGHLAKRQAVSNPERTIASVKRHIGDTDFRVSVDSKDLTAEEISAMILQKLKADAEAYLGEPVDRAVITVPAYFTDSQRQATKDAGRIAGLEVTRIINEPTAAALAYGMDKADVHIVLVWDLGGGTFDVSILEIGDGVFEVKATNGDTHLGGDDWDDRIIDWISADHKTKCGVDLGGDSVALQRLREAAERAKRELSTVVSTSVNLPFIATSSDGPVHLETDLTRAHFEAITDDLRDRMLMPTRNALADAKLTPAEIDVVLLVGGSTRMPAVQEMVREMFGKEPHRGTDPDEVVALGAAVQGGILAGDVRDLILLDVAPLSLSIETVGGIATRLIARNTTIPTSASQTFTTAADGQSAVDIHVVQGEREFAAANKTLGRFQLGGIPAAPRGVPKIEVTFEIDANGLVNVSARDKATGREQRVTMTGNSGLSPAEVDTMVREAANHAAEDAARHDLQDARNRADSHLYSGEKALLEADNVAEPALLRAARGAAVSLRTAVINSDARAIIRLTEAYEDAVFAVSASLYGHGAPTQPGAVETVDVPESRTRDSGRTTEKAEPPSENSVQFMRENDLAQRGSGDGARPAGDREEDPAAAGISG